MYERPEFSFDRPFTVSRPGGFTCNGHRYQSGDVFDWRQLGLSDAEIWDLWVLCQVDNVPAVLDVPAASPIEVGPSSDPVAGPGLDTPAPAQDAVPRRETTSTIAADVLPMHAITPPHAIAPPALASSARSPPSVPSRPVAAKGVTKPQQQNQLPRR